MAIEQPALVPSPILLTDNVIRFYFVLILFWLLICVYRNDESCTVQDKQAAAKLIYVSIRCLFSESHEIHVCPWCQTGEACNYMVMDQMLEQDLCKPPHVHAWYLYMVLHMLASIILLLKQ